MGKDYIIYYLIIYLVYIFFFLYIYVYIYIWETAINSYSQVMKKTLRSPLGHKSPLDEEIRNQELISLAVADHYRPSWEGDLLNFCVPRPVAPFAGKTA